MKKKVKFIGDRLSIRWIRCQYSGRVNHRKKDVREEDPDGFTLVTFDTRRIRD